MKNKDNDNAIKMESFVNELFGEVRSILINEEPWFIGKDIAKCLGYSDTDKAIREHVENDDKYLAKPVELTGLEIRPAELAGLNLNNRGNYIINESGVYYD